jgi:Carboxypeptidase regulatory-like domain
MLIRRIGLIGPIFVSGAVLTWIPLLLPAQQVTAAITAGVTDPSGAFVPNVKVTAIDTERHSTWATTTNAEGVYDLQRIPIGTYTVRVEALGFATVQQSWIALALNQTARLDFRLALGSASQSVEVTGAAPRLETDSTQLHTIIDARTNEALPLATRNYVQLTLLGPGSATTLLISGTQYADMVVESGGRTRGVR